LGQAIALRCVYFGGAFMSITTITLSRKTHTSSEAIHAVTRVLIEETTHSKIDLERRKRSPLTSFHALKLPITLSSDTSRQLLGKAKAGTPVLQNPSCDSIVQKLPIMRQP